MPTDRPIIFSGPMVRALLDGRKTQTRRLATSPLRRVEVGDLLYVREAWKTTTLHDETKPSALVEGSPIYFTADDRLWPVARYRPGMHMPRWASRLTLIVEAVRFERVNQISERDAYAEGLTHGCDRHDHCLHIDGENTICGNSGAAVFMGLWNRLHTKEGETWLDNPEIVALTFRVERGNIDRVEGAR